MSEYIYTETNMPEGTCEMMRRFYRREGIVRCRDCRCYEQTIYGPMCHHFSMSSGAGWPVKPDGFCAWACRR